MTEGWSGDDYLHVFSGVEGAQMSQSCGLPLALPGFALVGMRNWDDFVVTNEAGQSFTVPCVPLDKAHLAPYESALTAPLRSDTRFTGKVRWLIKPIVFGGNPTAEDNVTWVTAQQHIELVKWWNDQYRAAKGAGG